MFKLDNKECKITSVSPRAEFHGENTMLACDVKIKATLSNNVLDLFDPELKKTLFKKGEPENMDLADQAMVDDDEYLPELRLPEMDKVAWKYKGAGYRVIIHQGFSGHEDIIFINAAIDKFKFDAKTGGSVELECRIIVHPNEKEMGALCNLIQTDATLTLEPPSAEKRAQMELDEAREEMSEDFVDEDEDDGDYAEEDGDQAREEISEDFDDDGYDSAA